MAGELLRVALGIQAPGAKRYQKYREIDAHTGHTRDLQAPMRKLELYATSCARPGYLPLSVVQDLLETIVHVPSCSGRSRCGASAFSISRMAWTTRRRS